MDARLAARPDIAAVDLEADAADKDGLLASRRMIPDPTLRIFYTRDQLTFAGNQPNTLLFGVSLPVPLFDRGQHDAVRAAGRAAEQRHEAALLRTEGTAMVRGLLARKAAVEQSLRLLSTSALPKSASILEASARAQAAGQLSMTELLLSRRQHLNLLLTHQGAAVPL